MNKLLRESLLFIFLITISAGLIAGCAATKQTSTGSRPSTDNGGNGKSYDEVITDDAVSDEGLFTVHTVDDDYYFEIPDSLLDREMLLVSRIGEHPETEFRRCRDEGAIPAGGALAKERR